MGTSLEFFVPGMPQTQGSLRPILPKGGSRPVIIHDRGKELRLWQATIRYVAANVMVDKVLLPIDGPVAVALIFRLKRPAAARSLRTDKQIWKWSYPWRRPDLDRMQRAVLDALTGIVFEDDGQVIRLHAVKLYGLPGVYVAVDSLAGRPTPEEEGGNHRGEDAEGSGAEVARGSPTQVR
jgi:crossover junction endodeoxyribonuclease RusA